MLRRWSSVVFRRRRLVLGWSGSRCSVFRIVAMIAAGGKLPRAGSQSPFGVVEVTDSLLEFAAALPDGLLFERGNRFRSAVRTEVKKAGRRFQAIAGSQVLETWSTGNPAYVLKDGNAYAVALPDVRRDARRCFDATRRRSRASGKTRSHGLRTGYADSKTSRVG